MRYISIRFGNLWIKSFTTQKKFNERKSGPKITMKENANGFIYSKSKRYACQNSQSTKRVLKTNLLLFTETLYRVIVKLNTHKAIKFS